MKNSIPLNHEWITFLPKIRAKDATYSITNSVLNSSCFAWHPYGKRELFKTELVIVHVLELQNLDVVKYGITFVK